MDIAIEREAIILGAQAMMKGADENSFYPSGDWDASGYEVKKSMMKASEDVLKSVLPNLVSVSELRIQALLILHTKGVRKDREICIECSQKDSDTGVVIEVEFPCNTVRVLQSGVGDIVAKPE